MKTEKQKLIETLKKFFAVSVAIFEMQHTISIALGNTGDRNTMHLLHLDLQEEINKDNPDMDQIDDLLGMMEKTAEDNRIAISKIK